MSNPSILTHASLFPPHSPLFRVPIPPSHALFPLPAPPPPRFSKGELLGSCELPPSLYFSAVKADLPLLPLPGLSAKQNRHVQGELSASFWLQVRGEVVREPVCVLCIRTALALLFFVALGVDACANLVLGLPPYFAFLCRETKANVGTCD